MSKGLLALLDDIVALAKLAAASLDDAAAQAARAGTKAAGIVVDDAAVTPRYVVGLAASRELPIIGRIAWGSIRNKVLYLLPGALALAVLAPWALTPLLMAGGLFLCYEGFGKTLDLVSPTRPVADPAGPPEILDAVAVENERVASAIRTDFILSAEIMAIALATVTGDSLWLKAGVLAIVGLGVTIAVYGAVAIIVKADDAGVALAQSRSPPLASLGRAIVRGMPPFLTGLSLLGMVAMLWVGGGILVHGAHELGLVVPEQAIKSVAGRVGAALPLAAGLAAWLLEALAGALIGLAAGAICVLALRAGRIVRS